ncbi:MAG: DUF4097 domain-containing protein [Bacteroidia bacterium]|nr:DUF4097 domain-containing protein [Bacteroidia bacterium]
MNFNETAQGLEIESSYQENIRNHSNNLKFSVKVPRAFNVTLQTSGGELNLSNLQGTLDGRTSGGNIKLNQLSGNMQMRTSGGNLSLSNLQGEGAFNTSGGNISVDGLDGKFEVRTSGGNISVNGSKLEGNVRTSGGNISFNEASVVGSVATSGGNIKIDNAPQGIQASTSGGNIMVAEAQDFVDVNTSGGNISLNQVNGWIQAKTSGGNIHAVVVGDPKSGKKDVELISSGGDITLNVPANMDMTLDLQTSYNQRYARNKPEIKSDFDIDVREETQGNQIKVYAQGTVGSGTHRVVIKTSGGNIYLKKN